MNRSTERVARRWSTPEASRRNESSTTEESSSTTDSSEYSRHVKNTSTPLRSKWAELEEINRSRRGHGKIKDAEEASADDKGLERFRRHKERVNRNKHQDDRERIVERQKGGHDRHEKRRPVRRPEETESEKQKETSSGSGSSDEHCGESDAERIKRTKRNLPENNELPITEILKRSQESARTKYEHQAPLPVLSTDKIYVQHRGGFSAMKISQRDGSRRERKAETEDIVDVDENQNSPPIRVAVMIQNIWKRTGLLYQGLLGGMALMHFVMLHVFFDSSMEFILKYSMFSEIYTTIFSFLVTMCIVSTFDKFDLARFDIEHLRELYLDYNRAVIVVPLYLLVFCLHQVCAGTDHRLNLLHYYDPNDTFWENITNTEVLLEDLSKWQKISVSKDLLAVLAWLFVSLGNKDDSFLMYLRSMEKYAHDVESSGQ